MARPAWTPDGAHLVFRSDRDGVSNLYAIRISDGAITRVGNVLGGAFAPDVSPDGATVAFANYRARGYDVHVMRLDLATAPPAGPYVDANPPSRPAAAEMPAPDRRYRPFPTLRPRFWSPFLETGDEVKLGAATGGADPLFRHAYAAALERGFDTGRFGLRAFYQYDRWLPTFLGAYQDQSDPAGEGTVSHLREVTLRASVPLERKLRRSQSVSLAWRRSRETLEETAEPDRLDLGGIETAWTLSTARQYPYTISPAEGVRVRAAFLKEARALGSEIDVAKATADLRGYRRVFSERDALALRIGGGTTLGRPSFQRSFAVGGFPDGSLFDVVQTNHSVLRGYPQNAFRGRRFAHANAEYRFPLAHPQRGLRTLPVFLRHLHGEVFADAAHAWSGAFRLGDAKVGAGAALGIDLVAAHALGFTLTAGVAHGFSDSRTLRPYFRTGLAF
jgi:hypothetical protein